MKLYGQYEIAERLGVSRSAVRHWYQRGQLPKPDAVLSVGPVWTGRTLSSFFRAFNQRVAERVSA